MSTSTIEKPKKAKDSSVTSLPSLRQVARKFYKHINKCKECKEADNAVNREANIKPLCNKGRVKLVILQSRLDRVIHPTIEKSY